ncbi:MAG: addiction module antidote protein, HigA family [Desulfobacteraceae bacterium 4572_87]|nr:MAG: addiction module antidote protein, HigA family [Desulfobacteraceae bacterium 4572_87]
MVRIPKFREPTHPGEMLMEEFLIPMSITQRDLSKAIHVPYQRINEIVNGRRGITPSTALRLAKFFNMSEDFWMYLQLRWDLYRAKRSEEGNLQMIRPYTSSEYTTHFLKGCVEQNNGADAQYNE